MKNDNRHFFSVVWLSIFLFFISSGQEKTEWKGSIEEINGVMVVKNPKEPMVSQDSFFLEEELSIGGAEGKGEYLFSELRDIAADDEGRIYVLDSKEAHNEIKIFDSKGKCIKTFGKKGQGPGEMSLPSSIEITPQNEIAVNDSSARKIHFFTLEGNFSRAVSQTNMTFFSDPKVDKDGNITASYMIMKEEVTLVLKKFTPQLKDLFTIFSTNVLKYPYIDPFYPRCYWDVTKGNKLVWGFAEKYELNVLDSEGKLVKKIVKEYDPIKITEEEKEKSIEERFGSRDNIDPIVKLSWNEHHNAFIYLCIDDEGRIFVRTYERVAGRDDFYYDVFDPEGRYLAKIPLKSRPYAIKRDKLYTIEEDEEGYQAVKRYKVTWKY
jgi:hypothetical protein